MPIFSKPPLPQQRRPSIPPSSQVVSAGSVGTAAGTSTAQAVSPFASGASTGSSTALAVGAELIAAVGTASGTSSAIGKTNDVFPLSISADSRYLQQSNGTPFLICADSTWSIAVNIPLADINTFLTTITGQGFNAVMMNVIEHYFTIVKPPKERSGLLPFTKRLDGNTFTGSPNGTTGSNGTQGQFTADDYSNINNQAADWTFPNTSYWQAVETILNACLSHNVVVFAWVSYLGFQAGEQGWLREMVVLDSIIGSGGFAGQPWADNTKSKLWNYGAWLADRWKTYPNIIWVIGGDYGSGSQPLTTQQQNAVNSVMSGMKSVSGQASTLFTAHWNKPSLSTDTSLSAGSFDLNLAYCDEAVAETTRSGYAHSPTTPAFLGEYNYEAGLFGGSAPYRKYLYWGFLGGISGGFFGHEQLWRFDPTYASFMNTQGTLDASRQFNFWKSKPWWRLKPSGLGGMGTLITAGGGTASPQSTDYVAAAATSEGDLLLAYVPPAHTGSVTVDMTKLSATAQARWFDPTNSTFVNIGSFSNTGTHAFTTPGNNNAGDADWLLVLETVAGTSTGTSTATAQGQSIASAAGSSSGTSTASATAAAISNGVGSVSGSGTVSGVGSSLASGSGAISGTSSAVAVGSNLTDGTGTTSGTSNVVAVGASTSQGIGTSSGVSTATASGQSLLAGDGTGSASGTSTSLAIGASKNDSVGSSSGVSSSLAAGISKVDSIGSSSGTSVVNGIGLGIASCTGSASGVGVASGISSSPVESTTGVSNGTSTAVAIGSSIATATGISTNTSDAVGSSSNRPTFQTPVITKARTTSSVPKLKLRQRRR